MIFSILTSLFTKWHYTMKENGDEHDNENLEFRKENKYRATHHNNNELSYIFVSIYVYRAHFGGLLLVL